MILIKFMWKDYKFVIKYRNYNSHKDKWWNLLLIYFGMNLTKIFKFIPKIMI